MSEPDAATLHALKAILLRHQPRAEHPRFCAYCGRTWNPPQAGSTAPFAGCPKRRFAMLLLASTDLLPHPVAERLATISTTGDAR